MQKPNLFRLGVVVLLSAAVIGCASRPRPTGDGNTQINTLDELKNLAVAPKASFESRLSGIRLAALKETALSVGAQGGLAQKSDLINQMLERNSKHMDKVYNFGAIMLDHNIVPPVLLEGRRTLHQSNPNVLRLADRTYKILKQAHFATTTPNWREYLRMNFKYPEAPDLTLLPKNGTERSVWNSYSAAGWKNGEEQAVVIFSENLARLRQDFIGMVRYRKLLAQNMVTPPYVAKTELGITGGGDEMRIDDRVLRISALPSLQAGDGSVWRSRLAEKEHRHHYLEKGAQVSKLGPAPALKPHTHGWEPVITP